MKNFKFPFLQIYILFLSCTGVFANPGAGFFLPDSLLEMKLKFSSVNNLIIIPVTINGNVKVNLILDTGCRNLVLFGKKFQKQLQQNDTREIVFSGLGSGSPVTGYLSTGNSVTIASVFGTRVPVVVVPEKNLFSKYPDVHGVIGYDIFYKFEIEINSQLQTITFRKALATKPQPGFNKVALQVTDSRPLMQSTLILDDTHSGSFDLMIDTGSSIGLLLKTTDINKFNKSYKRTVIGRGLNGLLHGFETVARVLLVDQVEFTAVKTGIIESDWHDHASIGMEILKDYIVVLNYCQAYACFKKIA